MNIIILGIRLGDYFNGIRDKLAMWKIHYKMIWQHYVIDSDKDNKWNKNTVLKSAGCQIE